MFCYISMLILCIRSVSINVITFSISSMITDIVVKLSHIIWDIVIRHSQWSVVT